jgi:DNA-binding CsgD family transcriptional regulator
MKNRYAGLAMALIFSLVGCAHCYAYKVSGTFKNLTCFYPKVYLAVINSLDGFTSASYQDIISSADLDSNGNFTISGNDLPDEPRFYRLYVNSNKATTTSVYLGNIRNYVLLVLNNKTEVSISCRDFCRPYFTYSIESSNENQDMLTVQNILLSYDSLKWDSFGESKQQFLVRKRYTDLKQFADTASNLMASLWAVTEMHIDSSYDNDKSFFNSFAERFQKNAGALFYARQLDERLQLLQYRKGVKNVSLSGTLFAIISILLGCSILLNIYLVFRKKPESKLKEQEFTREIPLQIQNVPEENKEEIVKSLIEKLTLKEREILKMVNEGLSNKEIAEQLFVEVSTVKTHIGNIYQKTDIKNRKEVAGIARYL